MIRSIFANTRSKIAIHIIADRFLSKENKTKFQMLAENFQQTIKIYSVDELIPEQIEFISKTLTKLHSQRFTIGAMCPLFLPILLQNLEKVIYFDADMICNLDLKHLWEIDLQNRYCAISPVENLIGMRVYNTRDIMPVKLGIVDFEDYFNDGTTILNLNQIRRNGIDLIDETVKYLGKYPDSQGVEQDVLNVLFSKNCVKFSYKYNLPVNHQRLNGILKLEPAIYHYIDRAMDLDTSDPFNRLWFEHFLQTPFFDLDGFSRLQKKIHDDLDEERRKIIRYTSSAANRKRLFVAHKNEVENLKSIFNVTNEDIFITADPKTPSEEISKTFANFMSQHRGKFFGIIFTNYSRFSAESASAEPTLLNFAQQAGLKYGIDFVYGFEFLPRDIGGIFAKSFQLLNVM